jgi:hypothetical protein
MFFPTSMMTLMVLCSCYVVREVYSVKMERLFRKTRSFYITVHETMIVRCCVKLELIRAPPRILSLFYFVFGVLSKNESRLIK